MNPSKLAHEDLVYLAKFFGHSNLDRGLCRGFSGMLMQALMLGEEEQFFSRLCLIEEYKNQFPLLKKKIRHLKDKVKSRQELSLEEHNLLEIPAFFEGLVLYQSPSLHEDLFEQSLFQSQLYSLYQFACSARLEPTRTQFSIPALHHYGLYQKELLAFLADLEALLKKNQATIPLFFSNYKHTVLVYFDKKKEKWIHVNTNYFKFYEKGIFYSELDQELLAKHLFHAFRTQETNPLLFEMLAFSAQDKPEEQEAFAQLRAKHFISTQALYSNENRINLLHFAVRSGAWDQVKDLLQEEGLDPNQAVKPEGYTALHNAYRFKQFAIANELLRHPKIELHHKTTAGGSILYFACLFGNLNTVQELLQHPKLQPTQIKQDLPTAFRFLNFRKADTQKALIHLYLRMKDLEYYGLFLKEDPRKARAIRRLLSSLYPQMERLHSVLQQPQPKLQELNQLIYDFKKILHRQNHLIHRHRALWKPLLINLLFILTGIGLLALLLKISILAFQAKPLSLNSSLFFAKTSSQRKRDELETALNTLVKKP